MLKTFSITDVGKKRKLNEDAVYTSEMPVGNLPNLFLVADGMGGHNAGDYASRYTVETILSDIGENQETDPKEILRHAIEQANSFVHEQAAARPAMSGMGTTVVAAVCLGDELLVANVGDSRLYLINETIRQITVDHSLVEEMVRIGGIDRSTARNHPDKNIITRAVGVKEQVEVDFFRIALMRDDTILLCSDGLSNMVEDENIRLIVNGQRDVVEKAQELVKAANENGGNDNISVILIEPFAK
ncbi:MAG: Stp1/IreP family PP2C-type Ser/Thr phosphatase [Lachnospiraceae bacterium]|nr:Stp1/IreP family PP2C-type Ser/Thr phosphatase [Lachnospiraceae bacterium]